MRPVQIGLAAGAVVLTALVGYSTFFRKKAAQQPQLVTRYEPAPTVGVLVAAAEIPVGNTLKAGDLKWIDWPAASVPQNVVRKDQDADAQSKFAGQLARYAILSDEPIRPEKLIKTDGTGFLAAILPSGMRAIAISIDSRGANSAGGFILPNDRVDVIRTVKSDGGDNIVSETILSNIRVLAIGQNVQEREGQKVVVGETATLELEPRQVEIIIQAQRSGTLSLALRSLKDAGETKRPDEGGLTLVRHGVISKSARQ